VYCSGCGRALHEGEKFCPQCGTAITGSQPSILAALIAILVGVMFLAILVMGLDHWRGLLGMPESDTRVASPVHDDEPTYTNFMMKVQNGNIKKVTIYISRNSSELRGAYREGGKFRRVNIANAALPDVTKALRDHNVPYEEVRNAG
jgi:hypothetical protein